MPKKCAEHLTLNLTILKLVVWKTTTIFLTESFHPPAKEKRQLLKNPKKSNYYCLLHGLNQAHIWLQSQKIWSKKNLSQKIWFQKICPKIFVPQNFVPKFFPNKMVPKKFAPKNSVPKNLVPKKLAPEKFVPK